MGKTMVKIRLYFEKLISPAVGLLSKEKNGVMPKKRPAPWIAKIPRMVVASLKGDVLSVFVRLTVLKQNNRNNIIGLNKTKALTNSESWKTTTRIINKTIKAKINFQELVFCGLSSGDIASGIFSMSLVSINLV